MTTDKETGIDNSSEIQLGNSPALYHSLIATKKRAMEAAVGNHLEQSRSEAAEKASFAHLESVQLKSALALFGIEASPSSHEITIDGLRFRHLVGRQCFNELAVVHQCPRCRQEFFHRMIITHDVSSNLVRLGEYFLNQDKIIASHKCDPIYLPLSSWGKFWRIIFQRIGLHPSASTNNPTRSKEGLMQRLADNLRELLDQTTPND